MTAKSSVSFLLAAASTLLLTVTAARADAIDGDWAHTEKLIVFHQPSDGSVRTRHLDSGREFIVVENGLLHRFRHSGA